MKAANPMKSILTILASLLPTALAGLHATDKDTPKHHVLLVMTDDQGYGDLSCHGSPLRLDHGTAPGLVRIARIVLKDGVGKITKTWMGAAAVSASVDRSRWKTLDDLASRQRPGSLGHHCG